MTLCKQIWLKNNSTSLIAPGIKIQNGMLSADPIFFNCCHATGTFLDTTTNIVNRCDLRRRMISLQKLAENLKMKWGQEFVSSIIKESLTVEELTWLTHYLKSNLQKGFSKQGPKDQIHPSRLWLVAFAAIWRFGMNVHFVTLRKSNIYEILPDLQHFSAQHKNLVLVENIDELWKAEHLYDFETLITWCYNAMVPLCCEFKSNSQVNHKPSNVRSKISDRILAQKSKHPLEWLESDSKYKLSFVNG